MCKIDLYMTFSAQGAVLIEALSNDRGKYQSLSQNFVSIKNINYIFLDYQIMLILKWQRGF